MNIQAECLHFCDDLFQNNKTNKENKENMLVLKVPAYLKYLPKITLKGNSDIFKPRPYFWHEIHLSTHREQFGESRRPSEAI